MDSKNFNDGNLSVHNMEISTGTICETISIFVQKISSSMVVWRVRPFKENYVLFFAKVPKPVQEKMSSSLNRTQIS